MADIVQSVLIETSFDVQRASISRVEREFQRIPQALERGMRTATQNINRFLTNLGREAERTASRVNRSFSNVGSGLSATTIGVSGSGARVAGLGSGAISALGATAGLGGQATSAILASSLTAAFSNLAAQNAIIAQQSALGRAAGLSRQSAAIQNELGFDARATTLLSTIGNVTSGIGTATANPALTLFGQGFSAGASIFGAPRRASLERQRDIQTQIDAIRQARAQIPIGQQDATLERNRRLIQAQSQTARNVGGINQSALGLASLGAVTGSPTLFRIAAAQQFFSSTFGQNRQLRIDAANIRTAANENIDALQSRLARIRVDTDEIIRNSGLIRDADTGGIRLRNSVRTRRGNAGEEGRLRARLGIERIADLNNQAGSIEAEIRGTERVVPLAVRRNLARQRRNRIVGGLGIAGIGVALGASAIGALGRGAIGLVRGGFNLAEQGANLQETQNLLAETFRAGGRELAEGYIEQLTRDRGGRQAITQGFGLISNNLIQSGITGERAATITNRTLQTVGDIVSFRNIEGGQSQVLNAILSAFAGQFRPLSGVLGQTVTQSEIERLVGDNAGFEDFSFSVARATGNVEAISLAILSFIEEVAQAQGAIGDYARTQDQFANQTRLLQDRFQDLRENVGQALIPVFLSLVSTLNDNLPQIEQTLVSLVNSFTTFVLPVLGPLLQRTGEDAALVARGFENTGNLVGAFQTGAAGRAIAQTYAGEAAAIIGRNPTVFDLNNREFRRLNILEENIRNLNPAERNAFEGSLRRRLRARGIEELPEYFSLQNPDSLPNVEEPASSSSIFRPSSPVTAPTSSATFNTTIQVDNATGDNEELARAIRNEVDAVVIDANNKLLALRADI